jgi:hypothetical protein
MMNYRNLLFLLILIVPALPAGAQKKLPVDYADPMIGNPTHAG